MSVFTSYFSRKLWRRLQERLGIRLAGEMANLLARSRLHYLARPHHHNVGREVATSGMEWDMKR